MTSSTPPEKRPRADFAALILTLNQHDVEYFVVGGVAAVFQGAPVNTFDLDIVHRRTEDNVRRLLSALEDLDACYRTQPERKLRPNSSHLLSPGHSQFITRYGPLDVLGSVGLDWIYEDLLADTEEIEAAGALVRVLKLEQIIALKEQLGGEKDLAALPVLRRTLEEKRRRE